MSRVRIPILVALFSGAALIEGWKLSSVGSLTNRDVWWHLRTGTWILQNHALPHTGVFSQSASQPWAATSWLYDIVLAGAFHIFDLRAVALLLILSKTALAIITFLLAGGAGLFEFPRERSSGAKLSIAVLLSGLAQYILKDQPLATYISVLLFGIELLLLVQFRRTRDCKVLVALPVLFLFWANLDVQFVYGIALLLLFVMTTFWAEFREVPGRTPILLATALSISATTLTPYFYRGWAVFFSSVTSAANSYFQDFHAMTFRQPQDYVLLLVAMAAFLMLGLRRSHDIFWISFLAGSAALSFHAQRDSWIVTLAAIAVIGAQISPEALVTSQNNPPTKSGWRLPRLLAPIAIALLVALAAVLALPRKTLVTRMTSAYPVGAAEAVRNQHSPQPIFNSYEFGGFLTWYLQEYPVAIDGRDDLYGPDFMVQYAKAMNAEISYREYPAMNDARTLLLARSSVLGEALANFPSFKVIYRDQVAYVLEKQEGSVDVQQRH